MVLTWWSVTQMMVHTNHQVFSQNIGHERPFGVMIVGRMEMACPRTTLLSCGVTTLLATCLPPHCFHSTSNLCPRNDSWVLELEAFARFATYNPSHSHLYSTTHLKQGTLFGMLTRFGIRNLLSKSWSHWWVHYLLVQFLLVGCIFDPTTKWVSLLQNGSLFWNSSCIEHCSK